MNKLIAIVVGALAVCAALVTAAGSFAAEGALHPRRGVVPRVCTTIEGARCEAVEIAAADKVTLRGWYFEPPIFTGRSVMALHGVGATREQAAGMARLFLSRGYSVLAADLRGHGESGGMVTYGVLESHDVHGWADWLFRERKTARLYGAGESLGASVLLESLSTEPRFAAIVAECAYSSFPDIARERLGRVLGGGGMLTDFVVWPGIAWTRVRYGVDLRKASVVDAVRGSRVPILLIHGLEDKLTSPANSRRIYEANPSAEVWFVPGAGHTMAWRTAQTEFELRVPGWFEAHR